MISERYRKQKGTRGEMVKKVRLLLITLLLAVFSLSGCKETEEESKYKVYYTQEGANQIQSENFLPSQEDVETMAQEMTVLLNYVTEDGTSLLPKGIKIQTFENEEGIMKLDLSDGYLHLDTVEEVLLRAALVKDYVQIPEIYLVSMTVNGEKLKDSQGREIGPMSQESFLENSGKEITAYQYKQLQLYFANETGDRLVPETRQVYYSSNTPIEKVIVEQLLRGPSEIGHYPTLPSDTRIVAVSVADKIAYINLGKGFLDNALAVDAQVPIYSIVHSVIAAGNVDQVQISINGNTNLIFKEQVDMNQLFTLKEELLEGGEE